MISEKMVEAALDHRWSGPAWRKFVSPCDEKTKMRELLEAADAAAWEDIATAPRDAADVLLGGCKVGPSVWIGYWGARAFDRFANQYKMGWCAGARYELNPTHWRPLPAPPKDPGQ